MQDYRGRVAFVTGAGSGIGRETALALARRGARVGFLTRTEAHAQSLADEIQVLGGSCLSVTGDVGNAANVQAAVAAIEAEFGGLDLVVANAGVDVEGTIVDTSLDDWDRLVSTNLTGVFLTAKFSVPALVSRGGGAFVIVGSDASVQGSPRLAAYSAVKHGLVGLTRCMAIDHGPDGVRTSIVCPSVVMTPMMRKLTENDPETAAEWLSAIPLGRGAQPHEVAAVICHLGSDDASFTNGLVYNLDGGSTAGLYRGDAGREVNLPLRSGTLSI
jgi:meso-butanediol dehydrogenase / (S,S)-butanediol dehydrogenase / diacetyl reductase